MLLADTRSHPSLVFIEHPRSARSIGRTSQAVRPQKEGVLSPACRIRFSWLVTTGS